jgi:hypothetical protein
MIDTRKSAKEYRLTHWAGILRDRADSGLSIHDYCTQAGFHENKYYYWQRKLREAGEELVQSAIKSRPTSFQHQNEPPSSMSTAPVTISSYPGQPESLPSGWLACSPASSVTANNTALIIEVNHCRITITPDTDVTLMAKVCRTLLSL